MSHVEYGNNENLVCKRLDFYLHSFILNDFTYGTPLVRGETFNQQELGAENRNMADL